MMKKIGSLLLLIGIAILLFVIYSKVKLYQEQQKLMEEFESLEFPTDTEEEPSPVDDGDVIGQLYIPKIDLTTPIVEGASQENMEMAVGHLTSSNSIFDLGKLDTNFAIAGHRTATFGKFFNRLNELKNGDEFIITTPKKTFTFIVNDTKIVQPTDVDVVLPVEGKALSTLITCHPLYSNKQRLIITGEFQE